MDSPTDPVTSKYSSVGLELKWNESEAKYNRKERRSFEMAAPHLFCYPEKKLRCCHLARGE
jgi:hypothetical protein